MGTWSRAAARHRLALLLLVVGLATGVSCSFATGRANIHPLLPVRGILISCYHPSIRRYTTEVKPASCQFAGTPYKQTNFVNYAIHELRWSEWGEFRSRGSYGVNVRNSRRVRIWASDRIRCADGRVFYQFVQVYEFAIITFTPPAHEISPAHETVIRLPICRNPALLGQHDPAA